jgi:hypothetical protein
MTKIVFLYVIDTTAISSVMDTTIVLVVAIILTATTTAWQHQMAEGKSSGI